jgi:sec-independent protein translocase protein TatA
MHMPSIWGLLIVVVLAFLLFGRPGKLSGMMEDFGKGIRGFRKGLSEGDTPPPAPQPPPAQVPDQSTSNQDRA